MSEWRASVHHTHLMASDLDASLEFYRRWFDAVVVADFDYAGARNVFVAIGSGRLHFYDQAPRSTERNAVNHIGLVIEGLDALAAAMTNAGIELPKGLQQAQKLPQPIFTPATKAESGHDENISFADMVKLVGQELAEKVRDISIRLYQEASDYAATKGIIIADTKFEFGTDAKGNLVLIDEVLTADSSRFWPADSYKVGISPPSFDKQYVRDYLETLDWDKTPPAPKLPPEVIAKTSRKYQEALERLTGRKLA